MSEPDYRIGDLRKALLVAARDCVGRVKEEDSASSDNGGYPSQARENHAKAALALTNAICSIDRIAVEAAKGGRR